MDPLLPLSSKFNGEKKFSSKPQVNPLLPFSSKFSLENIDKSVNPLSNIRSKSSLVTNPSFNSSSDIQPLDFHITNHTSLGCSRSPSSGATSK